MMLVDESAGTLCSHMRIHSVGFTALTSDIGSLQHLKAGTFYHGLFDRNVILMVV